MVNKIREMFCKHDYDFIETIKFGNYNGADDPEKVVPSEHVKLYRCKKCGHIQRVSSRKPDIPGEILKWSFAAFWGSVAVVCIKAAIRK